MKKLPFPLLLVMLFIISFFSANFLLSQANTAERIIIDDTGFAPDSLTIEKGATVVFVSRGQRPHWPASDFHPTHNEYPGKGGCIGSMLDACRALKKGETYSFKFEDVGVWSLHDHLYPGFTMKISVVNKGEKKSEKSQIEKNAFQKRVTPEEFRKLEFYDKKELITQLSIQDPEYAQNYLQDAGRINGVLENYVHDLTHIIGHNFFRREGFNGIQNCSISLGFGCHHGITEEMLLKYGKDSLSDIESQCEKIPAKEGRGQAHDCIHGLGHGLLVWNTYDMRITLEDCDALANTNKISCYDGVFMEYSHASPKNDFDPQNPWEFCGSLYSSHQQICANYMPDILMQKINFDMEVFAKICSDAPKQNLRDGCVKHLSYGQVRKVNGKMESILDICNQINDEGNRGKCLFSSAELIKRDEYTGWQESIKVICQYVTSAKKDACLSN